MLLYGVLMAFSFRFWQSNKKGLATHNKAEVDDPQVEDCLIMGKSICYDIETGKLIPSPALQHLDCSEIMKRYCLLNQSAKQAKQESSSSE